MFYVYILRSEAIPRLYIGKTANLKKRVLEHNAGQNTSTKPYRPWELIFYEGYLKQSDANRREKYLKTTQGHQALKRMLKDYFEEYESMYFDYQGSTT
jgi:putative endonuclease